MFNTIKDFEIKISPYIANIKKAKDELARTIVGQNQLTDQLFIALLSGGHVLLEGLPGLAKTLTIKTLSSILGIGFSRIQFTPDMLPADIIGTQVFRPQDGSFYTRKGPLFSNLILADEINRAPAKVQSALLEVMQEQQITIAEQTYVLDSPFFVMATQNPIEQEGTYPLPEAQLDRFMMKLIISYPSFTEEKEILNRFTGEDALHQTSTVINHAELIEMMSLVKKIYLDDKIKDYVLRLVHATRYPDEYGLERLTEFIECGASPRATLMLATAGKTMAFLNGKGYVSPQDIKDVAAPVLRHRIKLTFEAEAENVTAEEVIDRILSTVNVP